VKRNQPVRSARPQRARILQAAFASFMRRGFAATSTLDIATAANVSKRELYAEFGSKEALLGACIRARAERMRAPVRLAAVHDRASLHAILVALGTAVLREASDPAVIGVFRLAIAEATPRVARLLEKGGREPNRAELAALLAQAQALGLIGPGDPRELAVRFFVLLWGDLMVGLLLRVATRPGAAQAAQRARRAAEEFLTLYGKA
jgi:AcrR family transcriptional regulator